MPWKSGVWAGTEERELSEARRMIDLPTSGWQPGMPGLLAQMIGVLKAGPDAEGTYRVWAESGGTRTYLMWPAGFVARLDPLEVLDRDGQVVAHEGDLIQVGGGVGAADPAVADALGASRVFVIHSQPVVLDSGASNRQPDS